MGNQKNWTGERLEPGVFNETAIEHLHRYAIALEFVAGKNVLDIACGEGYGTALLAGKAQKATGIDLDKATIESASSKYQSSNITFRVGSVDKIPVQDEEFDVVISFETIEHVSTHKEMISEIKRILKPGGLLIISTPDRKNYTEKPARKNPHHVKELYEQEFRSLLQGYFSHIEILDQQMSFSSVITARNATGFKAYQGDFANIKSDDGSERLYCIAFASNAPLPPLANSIFNGRSVFAEAVTEKENQVIDTITYKVGHAILYPLKMLRNLFKKPPHD